MVDAYFSRRSVGDERDIGPPALYEGGNTFQVQVQAL
jgi:hypothetical protein